MEVLRPRQILFEDSSGASSGGAVLADAAVNASMEPSLPKSTVAMLSKLTSLAGTIRESRHTMQQLLDGRTTSVADMLDTTGGRLAVDMHLRGQKANWKFQGAKEAFMEELSTLRDVRELLERDITSQNSQTDREVKALKFKIRDLNTVICKTEQELVGSIQQLSRAYEAGERLGTQTAAQLPHLEAEIRDYMACLQEEPEPVVDGMSEEDISRLLAEEEARAVQLEQQAASCAANWSAEEAKYASLMESSRALRDEVRDLEEACSEAAKKQGAQHAERLKRYDMLAAALSRLTGVEVAAQEHNVVRLTLSQTIPRGMPGHEQSHGSEAASLAAVGTSQETACGGPGAVVIEHALLIELESPDSLRVRSATLIPQAVDIDEAVKAAREVPAASEHAAMTALSGLVLDVKARIRKQFRRQQLMEDAHELYPLQPTNVSPELLRCVLPNKVEVEVLVPSAWPEEPGLRLQLVGMQAPRASQNCAALLARLQRELDEAYSGNGAGAAQSVLRQRQLQNCSLRELLDVVYGSVVTELGSAES